MKLNIQLPLVTIIVTVSAVLVAEQHVAAMTTTPGEHVYPFNMAFDYGLKYSPQSLSSENGNNEIDYVAMYPEDIEETDLTKTNDKRSSRIDIFRRGCIRRNGACDHRPSDCCYNSSCRCNLWGSNCRCQRIGLFQKWG